MDKKPPHPEPPPAGGEAPDDQRVYPRDLEYPGPGAIGRVEEIETGVGLDARRSRALAKVFHDAVREGLTQQNREMRLCFRAVYNMLGSVGENLGGRIGRLENRIGRLERKTDERHDKAERKADERHDKAEQRHAEAERKADERHDRAEQRHAEAERKADERFDKMGKEIADSRRFSMWLFGLMATLAVGVLAILVHHFDSALDRIAYIAQHPPALVETVPSRQPSGGEEEQADGLDGNAGAMPGSGVEPVPQGAASPADGSGGGGGGGSNGG